MGLHVLNELRKVSAGLPGRAPPIPLGFAGLGVIGHLSRNRVYVNSGYRHHVRAMWRDYVRAERYARRMTDGRYGADELLPIAQRLTDRRDAVRAIQGMKSAITSWDGLVNARGTGKYWDFAPQKASQTTVAANWSSFLRTGGIPAAASYTAIPGGALMTAANTGAFPLPMTLGGSEDLYLSNFGGMHPTGTNIVFLVDAIVNATNIDTEVVTSQNLTTTALSRWTTGEGVMFTLEVTTQTGATASNITITYTDQAGNAGTTGAQALVTNCIVGRLLPVLNGPMVPMAADDYGVRALNGAILSASMGTQGIMAAILYKPILMFPTIATTLFVERSTPAQMGGLAKLTAAAGGEKPFLGVFVLTSTTSTGLQQYFMQTAYG